MRVKLPRLLDAEMREKKRLHPSEMAVVFNLYSPHQATAILPPGETLALHEWVRLFTAKGEAGVFRVTGTDEAVGMQSRVTLHHGICILAADKIKSEEEKMSGTLAELLTRFWSMDGVNEAPKYWRIGNIPDTPVLKYTTGNETLLQAVVTVLKKAKNCAFSFDQSSFPWTLNIIKLSDDDACEGRFSRNLENVNISVDDSNLYTRVYVDGRTGHTDSDTVSTWGVMSEILSVGEDVTEESLQEYINDFLEAHKDPAVTIELSAADLSSITGEPIDSFDLGRVCRACLPRYDATIREKIVSISAPNVYGDPLHVTVSLGNKAETTPDLLVYNERELNNYRSYSSRRFGGLSSSIEQAYIDIRAQHEAIVEIDGYMTQQFNEVSITLDAINARLDLKATREELNEINYTLNETIIALDAAEAEILLKASQTQVNELDTKISEAYILIDGIESEIILKADKIDLEGLVTADQLQSVQAQITNLTTGLTAATVLETNLLNAQQANVTYLSANAFNLSDISVRFKTVTMGDVVSSRVLGAYDEAGDTSISLQHSHAVTVNETTGEVQLGEVSATGGNFNIADTQFFKDAVAAAGGDFTLTAAGWISNGENIVTAQNSKTTKTLAVKLPDFQASGGDTWASNKTTVYFSTQSVSVPLKSVTVDASSIYTNGQNAVTLSAAGWQNGQNVVTASNGKKVTVSLPAFTVSGGTVWSNKKTTVNFSTASVSTPLKSLTVDASSVYNDGYNAGYNAAWAEAMDSVVVDGSISSITNTAANTFFAQGSARAYLGNVQVASDSFTRTQTINVGQ